MPRALRVETPGFYHVVSRGNNKQPIFDDVLRSATLFHLDAVAREFDWCVYAWAIMSNHVHWVIEVGDLGLSAGMQRLNLGIARMSNARFGRINHCVGDRYSSTPIESERHLHRSIRYALWNPARAGVGKHPGDSNWTSFRASVGAETPHPALALNRLLALFGTAPIRAHRSLERFIESGRERCLAPWDGGAGILT